MIRIGCGFVSIINSGDSLFIFPVSCLIYVILMRKKKLHFYNFLYWEKYFNNYTNINIFTNGKVFL
jgi:hypothetical protein